VSGAQPELFELSQAFVPAVMSQCGRYRYELRREATHGSWNSGPLVLFCGANPSTADAAKDDPTIRKERGFARRWGCAGFIKVNLFAWRSKDPSKVPSAYVAVGPDNETTIQRALAEPRVKIVVAAWGDCLARNVFARGEAEHFMLAAESAGHTVMCFGHTKSGAPKHPLTLSYATTRVPWRQP
jgi:hypothetical protein